MDKKKKKEFESVSITTFPLYLFHTDRKLATANGIKCK